MCSCTVVNEQPATDDKRATNPSVSGHQFQNRNATLPNAPFFTVHSLRSHEALHAVQTAFGRGMKGLGDALASSITRSLSIAAPQQEQLTIGISW